MLNILNRFAWILTIIVFVLVLSIDLEIWFFAIVCAIVTKLLLSENFFKENL
jgi:hypothetical protein